MSDVWYLFDPDHLARAEQVMQRLRVDGRKLLIEQGNLAGWWPVEVTRRLTHYGAQRALGARLIEARSRGLVRERDPFVVLDRLSVRQQELEAAIRVIDDLHSQAGRDALEVYADFLQTQGDARGTLAMLQLQDSQAKLTRRYLLDHCAQILGPFTAQRRVLDATWMGGWIIALALPSEPSDDVPWSSLPRLPACACLRSLSGRYEAVRDALPHCPATLRSLVVEEQVDCSTLHALLDTLPGGSLEHFGFQLAWRARPADLRALLEHPGLRSLRGIALAWEPTPFDDGLFEIGLLSGPLLEVLLEAPLLHRLEWRDFFKLEVEEPQELLDAFASAPGKTMVCPRPTRPTRP